MTMAMPSPHDLRAKVIRAAYQDVAKLREELALEAAHLHRVYYKSKAQHRSAKWFQTLDALRKCYRRLLHAAGPSDVDGGESSAATTLDVGRDQYTRNVRMDGSLPNRAGRVERREAATRRRRPGRSQSERTAVTGSLETVRLSLITMWCSLWGEERESRSSLPKYDRPPTEDAPSLHAMEQCAVSLLVTSILLEELSLRSQRCFSTLTAQLRTPPAPTFAPLIAVLVPLAATASCTADRLLWRYTNGKDAKDNTSCPLAKLYNLVQRVALEHNSHAATNKTRTEFVLDAKTRSNAAQWQRMLNAVNAYAQRGQDKHSTASLTWLPIKLSRPAEPRARTDDARSKLSSELPPSTTTKGMEVDDDEDLGEAV